MPAYAVFEPPSSRRSANPTDRFVFMREGFGMTAFLFGPLWMIRRRLWFVLVLYAAVIGGLEFGLRRLGIEWPVRLTVYLLIQILVGLEATSLRRAALLRRRWRECGIVIADDRELAERRFFDARAARERASSRPLAPSPGGLSMAPAAPGVIGLFPEPEGGR